MLETFEARAQAEPALLVGVSLKCPLKVSLNLTGFQSNPPVCFREIIVEELELPTSVC